MAIFLSVSCTAPEGPGTDYDAVEITAFSHRAADPFSRDALPEGDRAKGMILVTVDTLRADYLSAYGHARILTPNFDRIGRGGVMFRHAVAQATTTTPSHASLMTSLYLQDHNVYSNFESLGAEPQTIAEVLKAQGFETFALVNMRHLNPEIGGLGQGFDTFVRSGFMRRAAPSFDTFFSWLKERKRDEKGELEKPYFAWIHLADVHTPYRPPEPYNYFYYDDDERDPEKRSLERVWPLLPTHMSDHPFFRSWLEGITDLDWVTAQYQGAVTYVDDELGRLMDGLEDLGELASTALVVTADHGETLGEHDMYFVHTGLYEATVRVPLLMYLPGSNSSGTEVRDVVELIDVVPTLLEYLRVPAPEMIRGRSLWPQIRREVVGERYALIEHAGRNLVAMRSERYKYIKHLRTNNLQPSYPFLEGVEELYDLQRDPTEQRNLAKERKSLLLSFRNQLKDRRREKLGFKVGQAEVNEETVEVLRALGYVE